MACQFVKEEPDPPPFRSPLLPPTGLKDSEEPLTTFPHYRVRGHSPINAGPTEVYPGLLESSDHPPWVYQSGTNHVVKNAGPRPPPHHHYKQMGPHSHTQSPALPCETSYFCSSHHGETYPPPYSFGGVAVAPPLSTYPYLHQSHQIPPGQVQATGVGVTLPPAADHHERMNSQTIYHQVVRDAYNPGYAYHANPHVSHQADQIPIPNADTAYGLQGLGMMADYNRLCSRMSPRGPLMNPMASIPAYLPPEVSMWTPASGRVPTAKPTQSARRWTPYDGTQSRARGSHPRPKHASAAETSYLERGARKPRQHRS